MLMTMLIRYYEDSSAVDRTYGITLVCIYSFVQWLEYLSREHNFYEDGKLEHSQKLVIEGLIKNKAMRMSAATMKDFDGGKI